MHRLIDPPRAVRALVFLLAGMGAVLPARADVVIDVAAGVMHNSNLTRAASAQDRRADAALSAAGTFARYEALSGYDGITVSLDVRGELYDRFSGLDFAGVGASASYRRKLGLGVTTPYVLVAASIAYDDYRVDVRDGHRFDGRVELGHRTSESTDVAAGLSYDRRYARTDIPIVPGISGAIFDLRGYGAFARIDHAFDAQWLLGGRIGVRRGDVESTAQRSRAIFEASDAIADDPAFRDPSLFGYRLPGTTVSLAGTMSYAIDDRSAVTFTYLDERTRAAQGLDYRSGIANVSFVHRF